MDILENIRLAWEGIRTNKMRALLTMLGIVIGIASVITIMTAGDAMSNSVTGELGSFGTGNITLSVAQKDFTRSGVTMDDDDKISEEMLDIVMNRYGDEIDAVALTESASSGQAIDGKDYANISVLGINDGFLKTNNTELTEGRNITQADVDGARKVVIVSSKFVEQMFGSADYDILGEQVDLYIGKNIVTASVIGVYEYVESSMSFAVAEEDISTDLYMPISVAKELSNVGDGYTGLTIMAKDPAAAESLGDNIVAMLNEFYAHNDDFNIQSFNMASMLSSLTDIMSSISLGLSVIAGISLLVGGIGVMNIMLVSVTERTREIGTRKALGATSSQILAQFIMESLIVCTFGGAIGMVIGGVFGYIASILLQSPTFPSITSIIVSVGFSMAIGVFFGYYPANKAAKLDPIEALRYE